MQSEAVANLAAQPWGQIAYNCSMDAFVIHVNNWMIRVDQYLQALDQFGPATNATLRGLQVQLDNMRQDFSRVTKILRKN